MIFSFLDIFQVLQYAFLIFPIFQCFSTYFKSYSVCFSFSMIFNFLAILLVLHCVFPFFHVFQCFWHISRPTVCVSPFPWVSVFFSGYSRKYSVHFSFSSFWVFRDTFQVKKSFSLIFHVFQFSCHIPGPAVCISHFQLFQCSSPYFTSYSVCFSFSKILRVSLFSTSYSMHFSFSCFSMFLAKFHFLQFFSFSMIFSFLTIIQVLQCVFLIFHLFVFLPVFHILPCVFSFSIFSFFSP